MAEDDSASEKPCLERLENVDIGDALCLMAANGDLVQGFVRKIAPGKVVLSHEHPNNKEDYLSVFTRGDRKYWLESLYLQELRPVRTWQPHPPQSTR